MTALEWDKTVLLAQIDYDEELAEELLTLFRDSSASDLQKIKEGMADCDSVTVAEAAHSIKGSAASLGIEGVRKAAWAIELSGRQKDLQKAAKEIDELELLLKEIDLWTDAG
ncbi:MAG: Hpt domain-containing protein [Desulfobia sp.]